MKRLRQTIPWKNFAGKIHDGYGETVARKGKLSPPDHHQNSCKIDQISQQI